MESFYALPEHISAERLSLVGEEAHHCAHVLRKKPGDTIFAIDGIGTAFEAEIGAVTRDTVECAIRRRIEGMNEPRRQVYLGISLLKHNAKFDIVVEKCTELGACGFIPLAAERAEREGMNISRLRRIALSAAKQSLRCRVPEVREPVGIAEACAALEGGSVIMAHEQADREKSFISYLAGHKSIEKMIILIGPEGGFTGAERDEAEKRGAEIVSLGTRRLRAETAAILAAGLAAQME